MLRETLLPGEKVKSLRQRLLSCHRRAVVIGSHGPHGIEARVGDYPPGTGFFQAPPRGREARASGHTSARVSYYAAGFAPCYAGAAARQNLQFDMRGREARAFSYPRGPLVRCYSAVISGGSLHSRLMSL